MAIFKNNNTCHALMVKKMQILMLLCAPNSLFVKRSFHSFQPSMLRKKGGLQHGLKTLFQVIQHVLIETMFGKYFAVSCTVHVNLKSYNPAPVFTQTHTKIHTYIIHTHTHAYTQTGKYIHMHTSLSPDSPIVINHRFSWGLHGWRFRHSRQHSTSWYS